MSSPMPEFRDHYWLNHDVIRPKPRRLGEMSPPARPHADSTRDPSPPSTRTPTKDAYLKSQSRSTSRSSISGSRESCVPDRNSKDVAFNRMKSHSKDYLGPEGHHPAKIPKDPCVSESKSSNKSYCCNGSSSTPECLSAKLPNAKDHSVTDLKSTNKNYCNNNSASAPDNLCSKVLKDYVQDSKIPKNYCCTPNGQENFYSKISKSQFMPEAADKCTSKEHLPTANHRSKTPNKNYSNASTPDSLCSKIPNKSYSGSNVTLGPENSCSKVPKDNPVSEVNHRSKTPNKNYCCTNTCVIPDNYTRSNSKESGVQRICKDNCCSSDHSRTQCRELPPFGNHRSKTPNYLESSQPEQKNNHCCNNRSSFEPKQHHSNGDLANLLIADYSEGSTKDSWQSYVKSTRDHTQILGHAKSSPDSFLEDWDCGSLSKSSSDGDPIVCRRRPPTRLKSKRRNILSFPQVLGVVEAEDQRRCYSSSDDNKSSGHASMSDASFISTEGRTDSSAEEGRFGRGTPLKSVPEDPNAPRSKPRKIQRIMPLDSGTCNLEDIRQAIEQLSVRTRTSYSTSTYSTSTYSTSSSERPPRTRPSMPPSLMRHSSVETLSNETDSMDQRLPRNSNRPIMPQLLRHSSVETLSADTDFIEHHSRNNPRAPLPSLLRHSSVETLPTDADVPELHHQHNPQQQHQRLTRNGHPRPPPSLLRHSSVETLSADADFVWLDARARLVELHGVPWNSNDVLRVVQRRERRRIPRVTSDAVPRLSFLLQRPLVRIAREAQRLARPLGMCGRRELHTALKSVLAPGLSYGCICACGAATAAYAVAAGRQVGKSARAGLALGVGRFHRWMVDLRISSFVHPDAAVYLAAAIEHLLEEVVVKCVETVDGATAFTVQVLEAGIAGSSDLWGLFQPFSHLNAGRTATGALSLPRWPEVSGTDDSQPRATSSKTVEQHLLTTCVGSLAELGEVLRRVVSHYHSMVGVGGRGLAWGPAALHTLFYFMRCSQLDAQRPPAQELVYERPYPVLPPLVEWVRVAHAYSEHRRAQVVDKDDVMQAARLLLPGVDCPVREFGCNEDWSEEGGGRVSLAFRLLSSGRTELISQALPLLPSAADTFNDQGLTPLMLACLRGDEAMARVLMEAGARVDLETPAPNGSWPSVHPETQHWTAVTYATAHGYVPLVKLLLENGANVEGGARFNEDKVTVTPLQLTAACGRLQLAELLLSHGAQPFLSSSGGGWCVAQRGCCSAVAVAAAHGQRAMLHLLLAHPGSKDVLSLEEILAEGATATCERRRHNNNQVPSEEVKLTRAQLKSLQEAMYHSAENGHIDITLDLRNMGVPWSLHCWMGTLSLAYELQAEPVIDQLLQDFLGVWPDDCSAQFVDECLPLLFTLFRHSKKEGTSLLLADIFSNCYTKEPIKEILDVQNVGGARIDPRYVNNPEMSDVQFRVEGRVFYAHKIILVNASPRLKNMLATKTTEPPVLQINDIRYDIFQLVMQYLYKGGFEKCDIDQNDLLELIAAASFFQLDGLLRWCESRCAPLVSLDNVAALYTHARLYTAPKLLEYCQGYLLQNMVALLSDNDPSRRLLFSRNSAHDVLGGLLIALQARVRSRNTS